jgi:hypothetical protein
VNVGQLVVAVGGGLDHAAHRQVEGGRELEVALVVRGHRHDRAGAVLHQHVVGDEHRDLLAVDGVGDGAPERHAGLGLAGGAAVLAGRGQRVVDVVAHRRLVLGAGGEQLDVGVLGRHHEERRAEQRVRPRREDGVVDPQLLAAEVTSAPSERPIQLRCIVLTCSGQSIVSRSSSSRSA